MTDARAQADPAELEAAERWLDVCRRLDEFDGRKLPIDQRLRRARARWKCGRYDDSIADFRGAMAASARPETLIGLAKALVALGRFDEAGPLLARARALAPEHVEAAFLHALNLYRTEGPAPALTALSRLARRAPDWPLARVALWQIGQLAGRAAEAELRLREFPADDFERAQVDSFHWLGGDRVTWKSFSPEVLCTAVDAITTGDLIVECGVFHGRSTRLIAARSDLPVHGFDSFEGLPEAWGQLPAGSYSTAGTMPQVPPSVTLHRGWFEDTLPSFAASLGPARLALLHVDCDLYSSTVTVLETLAEQLVPGSLIVFDDLLGFPDFRNHEFRAFEEYLARSGRRWTAAAGALVGREAAIRLE